MVQYNIITLSDDHITVRLTPKSGAIIDAYYKKIPFLRPQLAQNKKGFNVLDMAGFALIPFANRLKHNKFMYNRKKYDFKPNTTSDPYYLHGDAWLADWNIVSQQSNIIILEYIHKKNTLSPYEYRAKQNIYLKDNRLVINLNVTNLGDEPLPFGLGYHPYFPKTPQTKLCAKSQYMYKEKKNFLSGKIIAKPKNLNFYQFQPLPQHWVNNSFGGWNGLANIVWPEHHLQLDIATSSIFKYYHLFIPDKKFNSTYRDDYFCFEPISHASAAHHRPHFAGLKILNQGETLSGHIIYAPKQI